MLPKKNTWKKMNRATNMKIIPKIRTFLEMAMMPKFGLYFVVFFLGVFSENQSIGAKRSSANLQSV